MLHSRGIHARRFPVAPVPVLNLDFLRGSLNPLITFTRASSATYFNSSGTLRTATTNTPRFDYNPSTLAALGLLIEEQRTNVRTYSEAILSTNSYGVVNTELTAASVATPIGTAASTLILNNGANTGNSADGFSYGSGISLTNSIVYTASVYAKPFGSSVLRLRSNVTGVTVSFTLTGNGTAPAATADLTAATIQYVGNGWYRCSWTFTTGTTAPANRADYWAIKTDVADGVNGVYVAGAQLEAGAFPTSYIPTTTAAATRSADVASVTGTNFSSWYNATEGTLFANCGPIRQGGRVAMFDDGSGNNRWELRNVSNYPTFNSWSSGVQDVAIYSGPPLGDPTTSFKSAVAIAVNNAAISNNRNTAATDTSCGVPFNQSRMFIGSFQGTATFLNGWVARLAYYPRRLSNAELQAITS